MSNIYYDPEKFGLEIIWKAEAELSYEFDIVAAWGSKATGAVYIGRDSGCSCPSPFEQYTQLDSVNDLERIDPARGREGVQKALLTLMGDSWPDGYWSGADWSDAQRRQTTSTGADQIVAWATGRQPAVTA